jgi:RNA polymerase sigma factor (sigma-70 family)
MSTQQRVAFLRGCAVVLYPLRKNTVSGTTKLRAGLDRARFRGVFEEFAPRLRTYYLRQGMSPAHADELIQEVMLVVWHKSEGFDPEQGTLGTWIFTIARNRMIDSIRRQHRPKPDPDDPCWVEDKLDQASSPEAATLRRRRAESLAAALRELSQEQRAILELLYFEGKSMSEVADAQGIPLGTLKSRVRRAMQMLRERLPRGSEA